MVFPRKKFVTHMLCDCVPGTLGLVNPSGWMIADLFPSVMKHFIKYSNSTKENPTILIYDNHESHLSIEAINLAKENGVTILTLPPHCSNKMQPLDVTVYFSFKNFYNSAVNSWLHQHPGVPITIYNIASFVRQAFEKSMTPSNIKSGFRKFGIYPLHKYIFNESDFLVSSVTNRPNPEENNELFSDEVVLNTAQMDINNVVQLNIRDTDMFDNIAINENLYVPVNTI